MNLTQLKRNILTKQISHVNLKNILGGLLTFLPFQKSFLPRLKSLIKEETPDAWGASSALYCYEVWMKHLTLLFNSGLNQIPNSVAELGPGKSLGVGIAALLSGVNQYYALDVVKYSDPDFNFKILEELIQLFQNRTGRPTKGWPNYDHYLDIRLFPSHILSDEILKKSLNEKRIGEIKKVISNPNYRSDEIRIEYSVPWQERKRIKKNEIDLIISHAVLEHIIDLDETYFALYQWLKPNGWMSHQLHFDSHNQSEKWNGHWGCPEYLWNLVVGKREWTINRQPYSTHQELLYKNSFKIKCEKKRYRDDGLLRSQLAKKWKNLSDDDLTCCDAFFQTVKNVK